MCHFHNDLPTIEDGEDQYILDTPVMRRFVTAVNAAQATALSSAAAMEAIRPHFAELLADPGWLPPEYQEPAAQSGMGSNTGMWLLYRAGDGSLAFSALVLAPGRETPVHDHLAWGLVGLYRGEQDEIVYQRRDDGSRDDYADLAVAEHHALHPGDFYTLLPENDIHRVRTTSPVTSVSLHLLGNDNGCIARRQYLPDEKVARPFRSGYVNIKCAESDGRPAPTWDDVHESLEQLASD
jgi:predicted metal-dependent enzyme (double-stranded beta helix superfamily)